MFPVKHVTALVQNISNGLKLVEKGGNPETIKDMGLAIRLKDRDNATWIFDPDSAIARRSVPREEGCCCADVCPLPFQTIRYHRELFLWRIVAKHPLAGSFWKKIYTFLTDRSRMKFMFMDLSYRENVSCQV